MFVIWTLITWFLLLIKTFSQPNLTAEIVSISPFTIYANITVKWSGVKEADKSDFIALHSMGMELQTATSFLRWKPINESAAWKAGKGTIVFSNVLNTRFPFIFRYWSHGKTLLTSSNLIMPQGNYPQQSHLSLTDKIGEMQVSWITNSSNEPHVKYGITPEKLDQVQSAITTTYTRDELAKCKASDHTAQEHFFPPGSLNTAVLKGLDNGTRYYYQLSGDGAHATSRVYSFRTPSTDRKEMVKILYVADMGIGPANKERMGGELGHGYSRYNDGVDSGGQIVVDKILELEDMQNYTLAIHNGDLSYACGLGIHWDYFMNMVSPISNALPYMVTQGNHEYDWHGQPFRPSWGEYDSDSGGECGVAFHKRYPFPNVHPNTPWYSFEVEFVHFSIISQEVDFTASSPQLQWLAKDLASVNRIKTPWLIVLHHRQMYGSAHSEMEKHEIEYIEPLYIKHNVDLVLQAHEHYYQRTCPVINGTCVAQGKGPVHVVDGCAGAYLSTPPKEKFILAQDEHYGYTRISLNNEVLTLDHINAETSEVIDFFQMKK